MLVEKRTARAIAQGRQTELRLPLTRRAPAIGAAVPVSFKFPNSDLGYIDGEPKIDTATTCYVRVEGVWQAKLDTASDEEAKREGYRSRYELLRIFRELHPRVALEDHVWVIAFEREREHRPRFLVPTRSMRALRVGDYTSSPARAMRGEPEVVDDGFQTQLSGEAFTRHEERRECRRRHLASLAPPLRLAAYVREARERRVDIRDEVRLARRRWHDERVVLTQLDRIADKLGLRPTGEHGTLGTTSPGEAAPYLAATGTGG